MTCCSPNLGADMASQRLAEWDFIGGQATAPIADGMSAPTLVGTATTRAMSNGTAFETTRKIGYVSAAAINSLASARAAQHPGAYGVGTPAPGFLKGGGCKALLEWAHTDVVVNTEARGFCGLRNDATAPTAVDPTTQVHAIGFGYDTADTTVRLIATNGAGGVTEIDLGASFPKNGTLAAPAFYRGIIVVPFGQTGAPPSPVTFTWQIINILTGAMAQGTVVGGPAPNAQSNFTPVLWRSTGPASALAVGLDIALVRILTQL